MQQKFMKKYLSFVLPAIISSVVLGTLSIVDGLFIGNKVGDIGLAAINYAWPITAFIQAVGFGIGMGGSICISIAKGKEQEIDERKYLFHTYLLLLIAATVMFGIIFPFRLVILRAFGASGEALNVANDYITIVLFGTLFQVLGQGLVSICRNYKYNLTTMIAMSIGFFSNIVLDYVLIYIFELSLKGAAIATFVAQLITASLCFAILLKGKHTPIIKYEKQKMKQVLANSISPFGTYFAPNFILILVNKYATMYGGEIAVAAYTAVSYVTFMIMRLVQGVGDGAQPLFSFYQGSGEQKLERKTLNISFIIVTSLGIFLTLICILFRNPVSNLFGLSNEAKPIFKTCLTIMVSSSIAVAITRILLSYFYAKELNLFAAILVYGEPILGCLGIFLFPLFMNQLTGIWLNVPVSQITMLIISLLLLIKTFNKGNNNLDLKAN